MTQHVFEVGDATFDTRVLKSDQPTLVDFSAEWCAPCRALAPLVDELAEKYKGRLAVAKLDADNNPEITNRYAVRGLPTLLLFKNGEVVEQVVGLVSRSKLDGLVSRHVP